MPDYFRAIAEAFASRPYSLAGILLVALFILQSEVRFGAKARATDAGVTDRGSSQVLSLAMMVPLAGLVMSMELAPLTNPAQHPALALVFGPTLPWLPAIAWAGFGVGVAGLALRLWAVLTLRHRYTRTLLIHEGHAVERGGPYRFVRHPGYLGSLMCLNAIALTSGSAPIFAVSLLATICGYAYRVRVEDEMLIAALGAPYETYRNEVGALLPFVR